MPLNMQQILDYRAFMRKLTNNQLEKLADIQQVKNNMAAGMDARTAVKTAYPHWDEKKVAKYLSTMQI